MMKTIFDKELIKSLAPKIIKNRAVLIVIEKLIEKNLIDNIKYLVFLDRIMEMGEEELFYVAKELHVDYFDSSMSLQEKRKACINSLEFHSLNGTVAGLEKVLKIFFENATLKEWHNSNLKNGYFRIEIAGNVPENLSEVKKRIEKVKKKSQILEKMVFLTNSNQGLFYGFHHIQGKKYAIKPANFNFQFNSINMEVKTGDSIYTKLKNRR